MKQYEVFGDAKWVCAGEYAGFAKIVENSAVFDKIVSTAINADGTPVSPIVMKKVYVVD